MPGKDNDLIKFGKSLTSKMLSSSALNTSFTTITTIPATTTTTTTTTAATGSQNNNSTGSGSSSGGGGGGGQLPNSSPSSPSNNQSTFQNIGRGLDDDSISQLNQSDQRSKIDLSRITSFGSKDFSKNNKKESLKEQKKNYRCEKKRATNELMSALQDPTIVVLSDWLKVRGALKSWTKLWCVLKPGLLILYKSHKSSHWVATCLLSSCEVLERPSKKDGFCFKVFHPLDQSIWATKGPKGESIGALTLPLPTSYIIFRASSEAAGKCWMDALELALHCSGLLMRTMTKDTKDASADTLTLFQMGTSSSPMATTASIAMPTSTPTVMMQSSLVDSFSSNVMDESDYERHFKIDLDEDIKTDKEEERSESESDEDEDEGICKQEEEEEESKKPLKCDEDHPPVESPYVEDVVEELGQLGDACQTEEVADENKSIIWSLVKQVRPGMDLSRVALPTFILEPRSFLDKLSDYYYHADLLSEAVTTEDPFSRMKMVVKWYLSGFYKKPKGLKKPYNPILGETFRCHWKHPRTGSRTFYIAEQISHHPPVSAFYVTNRQDGFAIGGSILAKSKFYGNSLSAILDGVCRLVLLNRGEDYAITMPYAHCKGILIGTLTMEFGGEVSIHCEKTGYKAELEFKLKPFLGSGEASNRIVGKIKLGDETLATIDGHWDQEITIRDKRTGEAELFWSPTPEIKTHRLKRFTIMLEAQSEFESERLWSHVSNAIVKGDQQMATEEKCLLEEEQRKATRERKAKLVDWIPNLFERNVITGDWIYKYADWRPWDPLNDVIQYERDFIISTKTHHQTPIVHTTSITSMEDKPNAGNSIHGHSRHPSMDCSKRTNRIKRMKQIRSIHSNNQSNDRSITNTNEDNMRTCDSESSLSTVETTPMTNERQQSSASKYSEAIHSLIQIQRETSDRLANVQLQLNTIQGQLRGLPSSSLVAAAAGGRTAVFDSKDLAMFLLAVILQAFFVWWLK